MLSIKRQIESNRLVCPSTLQPLIIKDECLQTADGCVNYPFVKGVPVLFKDARRQQEYLNADGGAVKN